MLNETCEMKKRIQIQMNHYHTVQKKEMKEECRAEKEKDIFTYKKSQRKSS